MHQPPGGDPRDSHPTEQFWPVNPGPAGPGYGYQPPPAPGFQQHVAQDRRRAWHWTIGLIVAALLAGGGVIAGASLGGGPAGSTSLAGDASSTAGSASADAGQAAALNTTLNAADTPGVVSLVSSSTASGAAVMAAAHPCARLAQAAKAAGIAGKARACWVFRHRLLRLALANGIDGQFTVRTAQGTKTVAFERGVVQSVSSSDIVVRASDGTTWTWDLVSNTVVREHGAKTQTSALAINETVWVGGPVVSGAKDARLIVIRPPASSSTASPSATATPSSS